MGSSILELSAVFLKLLLKGSAKWKFLILISAFLAIMMLNYVIHIGKYQSTRAEKKELLEDDAFKVFFVYSTINPKDCSRLIKDLEKDHSGFNPIHIKEAFIFQKNLFIDILPRNMIPEPLGIVYNLFGISDWPNRFYIENKDDMKDRLCIKPGYIHYNGEELPQAKQQIRFNAIKEVIIKEHFFDELASAYFSDSENKLDAFTEHEEAFLSNLVRVEKFEKRIDPYVSEVEVIFPKNLFNILINLSQKKSATEIRNAIRYSDPDQAILIESPLNQITGREIDKRSEEIAYGYFLPRYIPVYQKDFITVEKHPFYESIKLNEAFLNFLDGLHAKGHYLLSYAKLHVLKSNVAKINNEIKSMQKYFTIIDILLGSIFAFTISFFSFVYLKKEIAFLLFHRNKIRLIIWIFYLFPLILMFSIKFCLYYQTLFKPTLDIYLLRTIAISSFAIMLIFWIVNLWCFAEFKSNKLKLYSIFKS